MVDTDDTRRTTDDSRRTTDDGRRTTPGVWHKLPTGELKRPQKVVSLKNFYHFSIIKDKQSEIIFIIKYLCKNKRTTEHMYRNIKGCQI